MNARSFGCVCSLSDAGCDVLFWLDAAVLRGVGVGGRAVLLACAGGLVFLMHVCLRCAFVCCMVGLLQ